MIPQTSTPTSGIRAQRRSRPLPPPQPLDMRRRPLCGPAGRWTATNPDPKGDDSAFRVYQTNPNAPVSSL